MAELVLRGRPRITSIGYLSSLTTPQMWVARVDKLVQSIQIGQVTTMPTIIKTLREPLIRPCSMNPSQVVARQEVMDTRNNIVAIIITTIRAPSMKSTMAHPCLHVEMKTIIRTALIITPTQRLQRPPITSTILACSHRNWQSNSSSTIIATTTTPIITQTASNELKNCSKEKWILIISKRRPPGSID